MLVDKVRESKVDEIMEAFIEESKVQIQKISENYYEYGTRKIYVKLDDHQDQVLVRDRGGRYI